VRLGKVAWILAPETLEKFLQQGFQLIHHLDHFPAALRRGLVWPSRAEFRHHPKLGQWGAELVGGVAAETSLTLEGRFQSIQSSVQTATYGHNYFWLARQIETLQCAGLGGERVVKLIFQYAPSDEEYP